MKKTTLTLLSIFALSATVQAESFHAKVKLTLVDPSSVSEISDSSTKTVSVPVRQLSNSHCTINAQSGSLNGPSCIEPSVDQPKFDISGRSAQDISVRLSSIEEPTNLNQLSFEPTLFNGYDQEENFQLNTSSHPISIGGTIFQHELTPEGSIANQALKYGIEVLYP